MPLSYELHANVVFATTAKYIEIRFTWEHTVEITDM